MRQPDHVGAKKALNLIRNELLGPGEAARRLRNAIQTVLDWEQDMEAVNRAGGPVHHLPADIAHGHRSFSEGTCEGLERATQTLVNEGYIGQRLDEIDQITKGAIDDAG